MSSLDKFQVYLDKQQHRQKHALQKAKNGSNYDSFIQITHLKSSSNKQSSTSILHNLREQSIKKHPHHLSFDKDKIKKIYLSDKKKSKSQYDRHHGLKKLELSIDKNKYPKTNSFSLIKKYNYSYSGNKRYNKSQIDLGIKKGYEHRATFYPQKKIQKKQEKPEKKRSKSAKGNDETSDIIFNSMFRTRKGVQIMNPNKVNQDRLVECTFQVNETSYNLYAVADGHGAFGHLVSHSIITNLPQKLANHLTKFNPKKSYEKTFNQMENILEKNPDLNAEYSGSTLVSVLIENKKKIVCANVGDSRAIIARQISKQNWEIIRLSDDHKPSHQKERKRILKCGGRVEKIKDQDGNPLGPLRVWLPKKNVQGLAMSRSFGDLVSKNVGVTHEPEILSHFLDKRDKFLLVASDGVWQFLTNYQILNLIIPYYKEGKLEEACESLLKAAYDSWTTQDNSIVDDISFILVFLS